MIIKQKIIFVLGAGASAPKYPTGKELKRIICHELNPLKIARLLKDAEDEVVDIERAIIKFRDNFKKSSENSIDLFLKYNPEFKDLGKQLIAAALLPKEHESLLFEADEHGNWYVPFWNMIDHSFENLNKNNIHFITFNYDRSLEHFLFTSLYHLYAGKKSVKECAEKINLIKIIHVYGCLAPLPWQAENGNRPYIAKEAQRQDFENAVQNLFIIGEERKGSTQFSKLDRVRSLMSTAAYIYFLGFGYDEENLNILGYDFSNANHAWGTCLNLGKVATDKAKKLIANRKVKQQPYFIEEEEAKRIELFDVDAAKFLKEHVYFGIGG